MAYPYLSISEKSLQLVPYYSVKVYDYNYIFQSI